MVGKSELDTATMIDFEGNEYLVRIHPIDWERVRLESDILIDNPDFETKSGQDAFEEWDVCDLQIRHNNNLREAMRKESLDHYLDRLALKL